MHVHLLIPIVIASLGIEAAARDYVCTSPDGNIALMVKPSATDLVISAVDHTDGLEILAPSPVVLIAEREGKRLEIKPVSASSGEVDRTVSTPFYRHSQITDRCNTLTLDCTDGITFEARVYDDGFAYRWGDRLGNATILDEVADYRFPGDPTTVTAYTPQRQKKAEPTLAHQLHTDMQGRYKYTNLSQLDTIRLIYTPALVNLAGGRRLAIGETDVTSYPGMYLKATPEGFRGYCAREPSVVEQGGHNDLENIVVERYPRLMKYTEPRTFPWRAFILSRSDALLADNTMLYRLAPTSQIADTSWIRPGKVAWEWWCNWRLDNVDFTPGVNTATYKAFIDFAAHHDIEYVILDEGWATTGKCDLFDVVPEIDLPEILAYAQDKGVGIILWAGYLAMERQLPEVAERYAAMGIKGFKVDFLNRDDAEMMRFMERCAATCAQHHLLVDFHGCTKPTGLQCAWPNVVNFEAVFGLEQMKWTKGQPDIPAHDLTLPFTRLLAGPMDYTPGAMLNFAKGEYRPNRAEPGSQGTRAHQLAEYVIFDSPLAMLCDSPSAYEAEPESLAALAEVPTVWDETIILAAEVGEYLVEARRKGDRWWIAGMTNWTPRTLSIDLPAPLNTLKFKAIADAPDAATNPTTIDIRSVRGTPLTITMAPGGGFFAQSIDN